MTTNCNWIRFCRSVITIFILAFLVGNYMCCLTISENFNYCFIALLLFKFLIMFLCAGQYRFSSVHIKHHINLEYISLSSCLLCNKPLCNKPLCNKLVSRSYIFLVDNRFFAVVSR